MRRYDVSYPQRAHVVIDFTLVDARMQSIQSDRFRQKIRTSDSPSVQLTPFGGLNSVIGLSPGDDTALAPFPWPSGGSGRGLVACAGGRAVPFEKTSGSCGAGVR